MERLIITILPLFVINIMVRVLQNNTLTYTETKPFNKLQVVGLFIGSLIPIVSWIIMAAFIGRVLWRFSKAEYSFEQENRWHFKEDSLFYKKWISKH